MKKILLFLLLLPGLLAAQTVKIPDIYTTGLLSIQGATAQSKSTPISSGAVASYNLPSGFYAVLPAVTGMPYSGNWTMIVAHHEDNAGPGGGQYQNWIALDLFTAAVYSGGRAGDGSLIAWNRATVGLLTGTVTLSGSSATTYTLVAHGLGTTPTFFGAHPASSAAAGSAYFTADATNVYVNFITAPATGTNNLTFKYEYQK